MFIITFKNCPALLLAFIDLTNFAPSLLIWAFSFIFYVNVLSLLFQIFDAGQTFSLMQVLDETDEEPVSWKVIALDEIRAKDDQHIYLVDHAWTFRAENARQILEEHPNLLQR